ncbi:MAG: transposase [Polyangiaceae bacterium]|nr:transposase [Polyangiaceae bacterium]
MTTDGSYDRRQVWKVLDDLGAHAVIPLRRGAMLKGEEAAKVRNGHLRRIRKVGRAQWRRDSGQHQQAKVENAIGRFKRILGRSLRARWRKGQRAEVMMGGQILNRMLGLGAPRSVPIMD